ncbi:replicative DNA helicase [Oceanobacillus caeni]|uniref:replicative DNA helicase n=1 Tax=Oceanobacillus caeni TaxID=405946 RepID=UPI00363A3EB2
MKGYVENPSDEAMDVLLKKLTHFQDAGTKQKERSTYDYLMEISKDMTEKTKQTGYMTSLTDFDDMTGGLQKGDLIIVAARPSAGKTAFALNLAAGHCKNKGSSLVISLEMGTKQLLERMISAEGMMDGRKWRNLLFSEENYEKAFRAIGTIASWDLTIFDTRRTLSQVRSTIRNAVQKDPNGHHLVIIDYLQLITPTTIRKDRRDLEIGEITRELKLLAMELKVSIVLLSQLSRGVESRQDKRPLMSDLRESGNIEQDADVIAFLYRDDYYNRMSESPTITEVIISKQRNGPTGTVEMEFWKEYGRFGDIRAEGRAGHNLAVRFKDFNK